MGVIPVKGRKRHECNPFAYCNAPIAGNGLATTSSWRGRLGVIGECSIEQNSFHTATMIFRGELQCFYFTDRPLPPPEQFSVNERSTSEPRQCESNPS